MKQTFKAKCLFGVLVVFSLVLLGLRSSAQEKRTITGVVKDAAGLPISGVSVRLKGTKTGGVISDEAGNFSIKGGPNAVLIFSSIGYQNQEVHVVPGERMAIQLATDTKELTEAVITSFGIKKDVRKLAYAITEVKGSDVVATDNSNLGDALQGKVAGVTISQGTGGPSSSSRIEIRGNARLAGNGEPLIVLDGIMIIPGTTGADSWGGGQDFGNIIKDLNPDDYESITVLKGSAASALYGEYALNGVLLINTKKGHARKGLGVAYNQTVSFDKAYKLPDLQNSYGGGLSPTFAKDASGNNLVDPSAGVWSNPNGGYSYGPAFQGQTVKDLDGRIIPWKPNNLLKDFFVTGHYVNTNVAVDGGNEISTFRASYTNLNNSSVQPNNNLNKNSFTVRSTTKISEIISLDVSVNYTTTKVLNPIVQGGGGTTNPLGGAEYLAPRSADINYYKNNFVDPVNGGVKNSSTTDPYYLAHLFMPFYDNNTSQTENLLLANVNLTTKIRPWLTWLIRANIQNYNDVTENRQLGEGLQYSGGYYQLEQSSYKNIYGQSLLTANRTLGKDFELSATVGGEEFDQLGGYQTDEYTNGGLATPGLYFIANSVSTPTAQQNYNPPQKSVSAYAYGDLTWRNMLTFDFSFRNDWNSALTYADGHGDWSYYYPSAGLAWVFTELPAFKHANSSILSFGKLRASIGWTGYAAAPWVTNTTGYYGSVGTFNNATNNTQTVYSFSNGQGSYNTTLGNQNLRNELAREIEVGADIRFFHNRLGADIAVYKKNSFDQILSLNADQESGISSRTINAGNIQNQGIEILLTANPVKSKDFNWDMTINFTSNQNKIIALAPGVANYQLQLAFGADVAAYAIPGKTYGTVTTGYAFATYNGKNAAGDGQKVIGAAPYGTTGGYYTFMRSQDYDGSSKTIGNIMPKYLWGTYQTVTYKHFILGIQVDSKVGGVIASATDQYGSETGNFKNSLHGRNAASGGLAFTDGSGNQRNDGIIPNGVLNDGIVVNGQDLGGMTYANAVKNGLLTPIPAYAYYENLTQWSSGIRQVSVFDNSWVALRQVSLGYSLPASVYSKAHLSSLRFTLTARNLMYIWKNAKDGINPEGLYNNQAGAFAEGGGLPYVRSTGATLNATF